MKRVTPENPILIGALLLVVFACGEDATTDSTTESTAVRLVAKPRTEIAFYGLISWTADDLANPASLTALIPKFVDDKCLAGTNVDPHVAVLKIVSGGAHSWKDGDALPPHGTSNVIFRIDNQHITVEPAEDALPFHLVSFNLLSTDALLEALRPACSGCTPIQPQALDRALLDPIPLDQRLSARVQLKKNGWAIASVSSDCDNEPTNYLSQISDGSTDCSDPDKLPVAIADSVTVRYHNAPTTLKIHFNDGNAQRVLTVPKPASGPVRIEIAHQLEDAAKLPDSRDCQFSFSPHLVGYRLFSDLRDQDQSDCQLFFHCRVSRPSGGTKCPQRLWG